MTCQHQMNQFRAIHPEFIHLSDDDVGAQIRKANVETGHPLRVMAKITVEAFAIPVFVLFVGFAVAWIWRGFRGTSEQKTS
jgi:hypothetical protein